jgi:serine protease AprX
MAMIDVLVETEATVEDALSMFSAATESLYEGQRQAEELLADLPGVEVDPTARPVPMFSPPKGDETWQLSAMGAFAKRELSDDLPSNTQVIPAKVDEASLAQLQERSGVWVWPNSPIVFHEIDCPPFKPGVSVDEVRSLLGVQGVWDTGHRGEDVVVGLLDEGIDGSVYPVNGGYALPDGQQPGAAPITSHGSMCAADILVAVPDAHLYDYPFLAKTSGDALTMLNAVIENRRRDGTPQVLSNSWGYYNIPTQEEAPGHEVWDLQHAVHRKIREVVASGATVLFSAGNCGNPCPSDCGQSSIGPGHSIHGANSLAEVITVAAVNSQGDRIGYSSQGPGMFEKEKPDVAAYSHFFGNFGPGRPGGEHDPFDSGTSAACPIAAGVLALLLSAKPAATPDQLRTALVVGTSGSDAWNPDLGRGIVNAGASYASL